MQKNIKNIIFDLGGVLLNINYLLTEKAFVELGIKNFNMVYSKAKQSSLFDRFETGKISAHLFRNELRKYLPKKVSDKEIDSAWNAMLLDFPSERAKLLKELKTNYRIFLLSNTNEIHINAFEQILISSFGSAIFEQLFEKYYYSNRIGLRKPDAACFEYVLQQNQLNPAETLFIDDSEQHVAGAILCGLNTIHLKETETINEVLKSRKLI